jgi:hypothetical protein
MSNRNPSNQKEKPKTAKLYPKKGRSINQHNTSTALMNADWSAFAQDNAKQMHLEETVNWFVPTENFTALFEPKHQILLGSRGSGKTTWVRLLSHDHVSYAASIREGRMDYAREALDRNLLGVYVPASVAFSGALKNKDWSSEQEEEEQFVWRLNLHCCASLTHIIQSCAERYVDDEHSRILKIVSVCKKLSSIWSERSRECSNIVDLRLLLTEIELEHQAKIRKLRVQNAGRISYVGAIDFFDNEVLLPLKHAINVISSTLNVPPSATWMICIDEVEYLTEVHHRILNTIMRASSGNIVLKLATMPFAHLTLATNLGDPVREGHDFEYVYVNHNPIDSRGIGIDSGFLKFAREIFTRRFTIRNDEFKGLSLKEVLGDSPLFLGYEKDYERFFADLKSFGNQATIDRAARLYGTPKFGNEIYRKLSNVLLLRSEIERVRGNSKLAIYSGEELVVRCCDGNPRRLVRVINSIIQRAKIQGHNSKLPINGSIQNEVLEEIARDILTRTPSEPPHGALTAKYLQLIGRYVENKFSHSPRRLGSDQVTSVSILERDGPDAQKFIKQAIQLSLMTPSTDTSIKTPNQVCEGVFHIAFLFAPLFKIFPRRNDSVRLPQVLSFQSFSNTNELPSTQQKLDLA